MSLPTRRALRLAAVVSLSLCLAYGFGVPLPYIAPLFALLLTAEPAIPMAPRKLLVALGALAVVLGGGLLVAPMLEGVPLMGVALVAVGLFFSAKLNLGSGKTALATIFAIALTLVSAVAVTEPALARMLIEAMVAGFGIAVLSQWVIYPLLPEPIATTPPELAKETIQADAKSLNGKAFRSVIVTLPAFIFLLINPLAHTPVMLKSIALSQIGESNGTRQAAFVLLQATVIGGLMAITLWFGLKLAPVLPLFGLWIFLAMLWIGRRLYVAGASRYGAPFWIDATVSCFSLLGPAVEDSANGKDPYQAFAVRFGFFLLVAVYTTMAAHLIDRWSSHTTRNKDLHCAS